MAAAPSRHLYLSIKRWSLDDLSSELLALIFEEVIIPLTQGPSGPLPLQLSSLACPRPMYIHERPKKTNPRDLFHSSGTSTPDR